MEKEMQNQNNGFQNPQSFNQSGEIKPSRNPQEVKNVNNNSMKGHLALLREIIGDTSDSKRII